MSSPRFGLGGPTGIPLRRPGVGSIQTDVQQGRFQRFLQKFFGLKGSATLAVGGEVTPSLQLTNGVENRYLESWNRFGYRWSIPAVAANIGSFRIRNPPASGVVAIIEKVSMMNSTAADNPVLGWSTVQLGTIGDLATLIGAIQTFDARTTQASTLVLSQKNNDAGVLAGIQIMGMLPVDGANDSADYILQGDHQLPVLPGTVWQFSAQLVNSIFAGNIIWRERVLEDSEKT